MNLSRVEGNAVTMLRDPSGMGATTFGSFGNAAPVSSYIPYTRTAAEEQGERDAFNLDVQREAAQSTLGYQTESDAFNVDPPGWSSPSEQLSVAMQLGSTIDSEGNYRTPSVFQYALAKYQAGYSDGYDLGGLSAIEEFNRGSDRPFRSAGWIVANEFLGTDALGLTNSSQVGGWADPIRAGASVARLGLSIARDAAIAAIPGVNVAYFGTRGIYGVAQGINRGDRAEIAFGALDLAAGAGSALHTLGAIREVAEADAAFGAFRSPGVPRGNLSFGDLAARERRGMALSPFGTDAGERAVGASQEMRFLPSPGRAMNRAGAPYPTIFDPRTGRAISFPSQLVRTSLSSRVAWGPAERSSFIAEWRQRGFADPVCGWASYDIHHIQPRAWGGTNAFRNLVPVDRMFHQQVVTPWWNNFSGR